MEKDIYKTLNDWHELLNQGIITESEFQTIKEDLLGNQKNISETKEALSESVNEPNKINFDSNPQLSLISAVSKKAIFIILGAIAIGVFAFYFYNNKKQTIPPTQSISETITKTSGISREESKLYFDLAITFIKKEWKKPGGYFNEKADEFNPEKVKFIEKDSTLNVEFRYNYDDEFMEHCTFYFEDIIKGDLDNDGVDEILPIVGREGPGNSYGPEYFVLKKNNSGSFDVNYLILPEKPESLSEAKTHMEQTYYFINKIKDGLVYLNIGNPGHTYTDEKGEEQLETVEVKCRLVGNVLKPVN